MLHEPNVMINPKAHLLYKSLLDLKNKNLIDKIGLSVNNLDDIIPILDNYHFDLIQAPLNIFDRRLITQGIIKYCKEKKVEIHARSIFLQGLLLMKKNDLPLYFKKWVNHFELWYEWLKTNNIKPLKACFMYVNSIRGIDNIVIGIENNAQLQEILEIDNDHSICFDNDLMINDIRLINPFYWKKF